jgi:hypothetical protein
LLDDAAAIVTHVEHDSLRAFFGELVNGRLYLFRGVLVERLQRDVADVVAEQAGV